MRDSRKTMDVNQAQENNVQTNEDNTSPERIIKHPLEHKWTFWFLENNKSKDWLENLHNVYTFDTVEDFWCLYNHIRNVEDLTPGNDYMVFKHGIDPKWEDEKNHRGGRWLYNVDPKIKDRLNDMWLNVILFMIGESFDDYNDQICGAFINIRKLDKISLWTTDASKTEEISAIGKKLKYECLRLGNDERILYERHHDSQSKSSSKVKFTLTC